MSNRMFRVLMKYKCRKQQKWLGLEKANSCIDRGCPFLRSYINATIRKDCDETKDKDLCGYPLEPDRPKTT
jgi:hypothetical protein